ncbi:hypothetical protein QYM36_008240 [Artemia franciscana]|uniref:Uncharacterized protein n=1 Tax=Artemia franciscana TaxID=6661 RepID=A0AA88IG15_ARTSF|nr:hypothetical protein QYM36_008240 [Artemia franciscana]
MSKYYVLIDEDYPALTVSTVTMNTDTVSWLPTSTPKVDLSLDKTDAPFQPKLPRYRLTNGQRFSEKPYSTEWIKYSILKKHTKTYLHTSISDERPSDLLVIGTEPKKAKKLNVNRAVNKFVNLKKRRFTLLD